MGDTSQPQAQPQKFPLTLSVPQVNKEIVSGLKCLHHTYRHGLRGEGGVLGARGGGDLGEGRGQSPVRSFPRSGQSRLHGGQLRPERPGV